MGLMLQMWILRLEEVDWDAYLRFQGFTQGFASASLILAGVSGRKFVTHHWTLLPRSVSWEVPRAPRDLLRAPAVLSTPTSPRASFI